MKKVLLATIVLFLFSASLLLVQVSCSKSTAQITNPSQLNKVLLTRFNFSSTGGPTYWLVDYTGSNLTQIVPALPATVMLNDNAMDNEAALSPDGNKLFFKARDLSTGLGIYSCDISGSNVVRLTNIGTNDIISGAY